MSGSTKLQAPKTRQAFELGEPQVGVTQTEANTTVSDVLKESVMTRTMTPPDAKAVDGMLPPTLFVDIDPIVLARVHGTPEVTALEDMQEAALAQGQATAEASAEIEASGEEEQGNFGPPQTGANLPPANTSVPAVSQSGATLNCTMGNWTGQPTSYAYAWKIAGASVGTNSNAYAVQAGDVGKTATCVVTATNPAGATAAPPSVGLVIT